MEKPGFEYIKARLGRPADLGAHLDLYFISVDAKKISLKIFLNSCLFEVVRRKGPLFADTDNFQTAGIFLRQT